MIDDDVDLNVVDTRKSDDNVVAPNSFDDNGAYYFWQMLTSCTTEHTTQLTGQQNPSTDWTFFDSFQGLVWVVHLSMHTFFVCGVYLPDAIVLWVEFVYLMMHAVGGGPRNVFCSVARARNWCATLAKGATLWVHYHAGAIHDVGNGVELSELGT